jgi:YHS domain-containing protein
MTRTTLWTAVVAVGLGAGITLAEQPSTAPTSQPSTQPAAVNKTCPVSGKDHAIDPAVTIQYDGKTIGFCCKDCIPDFKKDPAKYMAKLD